METKELIDLCVAVVKDSRVIGIAILTIFFMSLGNYVVRYKKRPPRAVKMKAVHKEKAPAPKKEEKKEEDEEE